MKYECPCGYVYDPALGDPDNGVAPGTAWEDVPEDWVCPVCGLGKDAFEAAFQTYLIWEVDDPKKCALRQLDDTVSSNL